MLRFVIPIRSREIPDIDDVARAAAEQGVNGWRN
jgi:hypothetical protein